MKKNFDIPVKVKLGDDNIPFVEIEYTALYQHLLKEVILRNKIEVDGILNVKLDEDYKNKEQCGYYFGIVRMCAMKGFEQTDWEHMTPNKADIRLRLECCYEEMINKKSGEIIRIPFDIESATVSEMAQYITTCIKFIEEFLGVKVPEADKNYKTKL